MKIKSQNYCKGQAMITTTIFVLFVSLGIIFTSSSTVLKETRIARDLISSRKSYFLSEAGAEDVSYRLITGRHYSPTQVLSLDGFFATTTVVDVSGDKEITATGTVTNLVRKIKTRLTTDSGVSFHYGVQAGEGGFDIQNSASISGNVYSNGPVTGANSNLIQGSVVSAGPAGSINSIHATSSAYAHTISNSTIDGDAYYMHISNTTVGGTPHPNSPDQPLGALPISDEQINEWEAAASIATTTSPCPYIINSDTTIGPRTFTCNVEIKGSPTVTLTGPIWIKGNLTIENTSIIRLDPSLGKNSLAIVADNPSNRLTSSKIILSNSAQFQNSGTDGSHILLVSQNNSAENGGSEEAIDIGNSVSGELLLYASHGAIDLNNSVNLREVSAYKISIKNSAQVIYKTGLANLLFESGPAGGYSINNWLEVQ